MDYANHSADEVNAVVKRIIGYYPTLSEKRSWGSPQYTCPIQQEEYYLTNAIKQSQGLPPAIQAALNTKLHDLRSAADKIEANCKALDTYHKLEDYKQDNFTKARALIQDLQQLLVTYKAQQTALNNELLATHKKLSAGSPDNGYRKADAMMQEEVARERRLLDSWSFNLNEELHTGWPVEKLEQSILETDTRIGELKKANPTLKYPASSMWTNFQGSLASVLEVKRSALDEYNFEAKKSDKHSNDVYLGLINYFNGTLVSDQNSFVQFAANDGYFGLKTIHYFPLFEIKTKSESVKVVTKPFVDIPRAAFVVSGQKAAITPDVHETLSNYVAFINETWRQTRYLQMVLGSFNSSAAYYRNLESFERKAGLSFDYKTFQLPLSQYQKTIADSKMLTPAHAKSLNDQTTVVLNILKELDDLCAALETETREKKYEKDHLDHIYEMLERQKVLFGIWDERKEILYSDVRSIYDTYPPKQATDSWYISGHALRTLTDLDHAGLVIAKKYYQGGPRNEIPTEKIDETLRDVIAKEYENMTGIKKIGRNNGLCPYTPYEDLPVTSKSLSEEFKALKPPTGTSKTNHPYHRMVYHYNDIVDDYNKFCELSKEALHLKTVKQPELFEVSYPTSSEKKASQDPVASSVPVSTPVESKVVAQQHPETSTQPVHVGSTAKVLHDTIYIERRDTVFLSAPGENLRSMEGYATNNLILLLDVSGSMNAPDKLPLLKESVLDLLSMMRQEDEVSIIAFSDKPKALLTAASFTAEDKIKRAINNLKPSGKTDGNAAVKLAYKVADENYIRGGNNRIILATDGEFMMSDDTRQLIEKFSGGDIFLSVFNFGKGAGASRALERVAELGKGNYEHISKENVSLKLIGEVKAKRMK